MKLVTKLILSVVTMLVVAIAGAQFHQWEGLVVPSAVFAYDLRSLHREVSPTVTARPNGNGILVSWNAITSNTASPADADGGIPISFRLERREGRSASFPAKQKIVNLPGYSLNQRVGGSTDYIEIATLPNSPSRPNGKIGYRDDTPIPSALYHYRLVVIYPNGYEATLRESKRKQVGRYDIRLEASLVASGVELSWKPVLWEATSYSITRIPQGGFSDKIGEVDHDPAARRLQFIDTDAVSGESYTYVVGAYNPSTTMVPAYLIDVTVE